MQRIYRRWWIGSLDCRFTIFDLRFTGRDLGVRLLFFFELFDRILLMVNGLLRLANYDFGFTIYGRDLSNKASFLSIGLLIEINVWN
ncbi:hypothetical protein CLW00_11259 [Mongoliibacter ruber]|uniref:Uncharacterized protein n=1 Tax=Mongoliibacter ruber TaxID=1750599 RepID=A0A2T0WFJ2_9BACT|nr:hypothetical protein CLW00_11259 [Mongoliibacter ruber]